MGLFFTALNVKADEYLDENRLDLVFSSWSSAENCNFSNCTANSFPLKVWYLVFLSAWLKLFEEVLTDEQVDVVIRHEEGIISLEQQDGSPEISSFWDW